MPSGHTFEGQDAIEAARKLGLQVTLPLHQAEGQTKQELSVEEFEYLAGPGGESARISPARMRPHLTLNFKAFVDYEVRDQVRDHADNPVGNAYFGKGWWTEVELDHYGTHGFKVQLMVLSIGPYARDRYEESAYAVRVSFWQRSEDAAFDSNWAAGESLTEAIARIVAIASEVYDQHEAWTSGKDEPDEQPSFD